MRLLQDIVNFSNHGNVGAAIVSLDQEKAFDRMDWRYMLNVLRRMVQLLYSGIFSRVLVYRYTSEAFRRDRDVLCPRFFRF